MPELSAQELASFNDVLAGHVRAGLPLEAGLRAAAAGWPGHAGSVLRRLTERLEQGADLETALIDLGPALPAEYAALVRAGQRSGRLPEVLDEITELAALRLEARRLTVLSTVYPVLVALVAVGLGFFVWTRMLPAFLDDLVDSRADIPIALSSLAQSGRAVGQWLSVPGLIAVGIVAIALFLLFLIRIGPISERYTRILPFVGRAIRDARMAYWARLVALLLEHGTPEAEAVDQAARATGRQSFVDEMTRISDILRSGNRPSSSDWKAAAVPPLAAWAIAWPGPLSGRLATLRVVSSEFARRSARRMIVASRLLPLVMLVGIGGLFTLVYGLLLFWPLASLYERINGS